MKALVSWVEIVDPSSCLLRSCTKCSSRNLLSSCWPLASEVSNETRVAASWNPNFRRLAKRLGVAFELSSLLGAYGVELSGDADLLMSCFTESNEASTSFRKAPFSVLDVSTVPPVVVMLGKMMG